MQFSVLQYRVHHLLGECLGSVPDAVFDDLTEGDFSDADDHFLCCFVRCYLVVQGRQPMALLNRCVDASLNNPDRYSDLGFPNLTEENKFFLFK